MANETKFDRDTNLFDVNGLDLNRPVDSIKPGKIPYGKNIRSYQAGRVEPREGLTNIALVVVGQTNVHSCRRLNTGLGATDYTRVLGVADHLAYGKTSFTDLGSGYSGNPLALVPWKPEASPTPFMYVGDSSQMRKVNASGALHTVGFAAPAAPPTVALTTPVGTPGKDVDTFQATTGWVQAGTAGGPTFTADARVNTTITYILYDTGTSGWCSISPASMENIGQWGRLALAGSSAETVLVQETFPGLLPGATATTAISQIIFDSGTSGLCSIALTVQVEQLVCDAMIRNTTKSENARVIAVEVGPDGNKSIRVSAPSTWAATDAILVMQSFRTYTVNASHVATDTIKRGYMTSAIGSGTGTLSKIATLDLSTISSTGPALHPDDYMHISMRVSDPTVVTELKVQLDVDINSVSGGAFTATAFTQNYYTRSFRPNDLSPSLGNLQSLLATRQSIIQRTIIDSPVTISTGSPDVTATSSGDIPTPEELEAQGIGALDLGGLTREEFSAQLEAEAQQARSDQQTELAEIDNAISQQLQSGVNQFVELRFRLGDLTRVGTDYSRSLANVVAIRIVAIVTGAVTVYLDSWLVNGGYGPDTGDATTGPYFYRYRVRNPITNVASNFSPPVRYAANPLRQSVTVTPTQYSAPSGTSLSTSDFVIDIARFGGQIGAWHYVGTVANGASPTFADIYPDDVAAGNPIQSNDNYQPWPIIGLPVTGTTGTVAGTTVNDSGSNFSTSWAPGTRILINSQPYTIYRVISTSRLELSENAGGQSSVVWRIDEPTILAQPLPCLWQYDNRFFACGDSVNLGRLYYTNPDSETTSIENYLEVTGPSEPLMNGVYFNVRCFLWSSDNFFQVRETGNPNEPFTSEKIPNGKGLFSRWAITLNPTPILCYLAKDGIYATTGGEPVSLTDEDLYPLFPNEGNVGQTVQGIPPPLITLANAAKLRLAYYDQYLYFDYPDADGYSTLVGVFEGQSIGWWWDRYTPNVDFHYGEEGPAIHSLLIGAPSSGNVFQYTGNADVATAIECAISTPSRDQGDARLNKFYGDIMLDLDAASVNIVAQPFFNNNVTSASSKTFTNSARGLVTIPTGSSGAWRTARNISLSISFSVSTSSKPKFYIWEPRWTFESAPISALSWEISPSSLGSANYKHCGLVRIGHVSTVDLELIFVIDDVAQTAITIANSGGVYQQDIFRVPVMKGKLWQILLKTSDDLTDFRVDPRATSFEIKGWGSDNQYNRVRALGDYSFEEG